MISLENIAAKTGVPASMVLLSAAKIIEYREISGQFTEGMSIKIIGENIYLTQPLARLVQERLKYEQSA